MRAAILLASIASLALASGVGAVKAPPYDYPEFTIAAHPNPVVFGAATTIAGKAVSTWGDTQHTITLHADSAPYDEPYENVAMTTTDANGNYAFTGLEPQVNTRYLATTECLVVCAQIACPVEIASPLPCIDGSGSKVITVAVRIKLTLDVSDRTPASGARVRFSGSATPAHDGATVRIQRRTRRRGWVTVRRKQLQDAGADHSDFSTRILVRRSGKYRARVYGDADHAGGASRARRISVH